MRTCLWDRLTPATVKFRENNLCAWIRQPANTWSNLGYVGVGLWLFYGSAADRPSAWATVVPVTAILVGLGSFLYHASYSLVFQILDLASMYLLSSFMVTFNLKRLLRVPDGLFLLLFLLVSLTSVVAFVILRRKSGFLIFGAQVLLSALLEGILWLRREPASHVQYALALAICAVSLVFWGIDYAGRGFDPDNHVLQGHALWHMISALCFVFLYNHYQQFV